MAKRLGVGRLGFGKPPRCGSPPPPGRRGRPIRVEALGGDPVPVAVRLTFAAARRGGSCSADTASAVRLSGPSAFGRPVFVR